MTTYRIKDWDKHFENSRTRSMKKLDYILVPNKHDGDGFTSLMAYRDGTALFGAWMLILEAASKCFPRGTLLRNAESAHDATSLARVTGGSKKVIERALQVLSGKEIGWIEKITLTDNVKPQGDGEKPRSDFEKPQGDGSTRTKTKTKTESKEKEKKIEEEVKAAAAALSPEPEQSLHAPPPYSDLELTRKNLQFHMPHWAPPDWKLTKAVLHAARGQPNAVDEALASIGDRKNVAKSWGFFLQIVADFVESPGGINGSA